jgi:hypothetical protein
MAVALGWRLYFGWRLGDERRLTSHAAAVGWR